MKLEYFYKKNKEYIIHGFLCSIISLVVASASEYFEKKHLVFKIISIVFLSTLITDLLLVYDDREVRNIENNENFIFKDQDSEGLYVSLITGVTETIVFTLSLLILYITHDIIGVNGVILFLSVLYIFVEIFLINKPAMLLIKELILDIIILIIIVIVSEKIGNIKTNLNSSEGFRHIIVLSLLPYLIMAFIFIIIYLRSKLKFIIY